MTEQPLIKLPDSAIVQVSHAQCVGPCDAQDRIDLSIHLRAETDLAGREQVLRFLTRAGLNITAVVADQQIIRAEACVQDINVAFDTEVCNFTTKGQSFRAYVGDLSIPEAMGPLILGVFGIENIKLFRPHLRVAANDLTAQESPTSRGYTPPQVGALYNFPPQLTGAGQRIALIELGGGYDVHVIEDYFSNTLHTKTPFLQDHCVGAAVNCLAPGQAVAPDWAAINEVYLDIEVCASLAPEAQCHVYFCPGTPNGFISGLSQAISDDNDVISISWGVMESAVSIGFISAMNKLLALAASKGISVCVSAGDNGASGYSQEDFINSFENGLANPEYPATSPSVLACGGTHIQTTAGQAISREIVWNDWSAGGGATGGGVSGSSANPVPTYQSRNRINLPSANPNQSYSGRVIPDVAANADPSSGYIVQTQPHSTTVVGGTSAVAPLWAALLALINQHFGKRMGMIHPALYAHLGLTPAFNQVTQGNNINASGSPGYVAAPGFNACTGWGSPNAGQLIQNLTDWLAKQAEAQTAVAAPTLVAHSQSRQGS